MSRSVVDTERIAAAAGDIHRTLGEETASPPERDARAQQRRFDPWRHQYNHERPHEALGQRRPASVYTRSRRAYPCQLVRVAEHPFARVTRIDKRGFITWHRRKVFVSSALAYELIHFEPDLDRDVDGCWDVRWGPILVGRLDEHHPERGLVTPRRPRGTISMSLVECQ